MYHNSRGLSFQLDNAHMIGKLLTMVKVISKLHRNTTFVVYIQFFQFWHVGIENKELLSENRDDTSKRNFNH